MARWGGDNFRLWKIFSRTSKGEETFFAKYRGKNFIFHNLFHKVVDVENFLGGGKQENVFKNKKGGWKIWLWTRVQMRGENILEIF